MKIFQSWLGVFLLGSCLLGFVVSAPQSRAAMMPLDGTWVEIIERGEEPGEPFMFSGGPWNFISEYPDLFAAAVPICGGGDPTRLKINLRTEFPKNFTMKKLASAKDLPIRVYHGDRDNAVPEGESKLLVDSLKKAGSTNVEYTVYRGVGHNSWTRTYADEKLWKWLFAQKKTK